jgi:septal ring factor EnvC (AmiA/AmiB activator)
VLTADLDAKRDRIARVLGAMVAMQDGPGPLLLLHPDGPEAAVRSGLVLSAMTPALQAEADVLRGKLAEIAQLRQLRQDAAATLKQGLVTAQEARTALSQAMQDRVGLPTRFLSDPEELKTLVASADTLDTFAAGVATMETDIGPPMEDFAAARGTLAMPVFGRLLRKAGEADAAGIRRPGLVIAARPAALVTTPWPATIRYRGPLLDYGNVMILEPAKGYLLVLAGLGTVYGETGDVLARGAPLGLMPGATGADAAKDRMIAATDQEVGGTERPETLYMELRQDGAPVDPGPWFRDTKDD